MPSRTIDELVLDLKQRRLAGDLPPTLLLGAGASVEAGVGAMPALYELAGVLDFKAFSKFISERTETERFRFLMSFLQTLRPQDITPGYRALAALCEEGYIDLILTTNLDPLLDDALAAARLWRKDYLLLVNGVLRGDRLLPLLRATVPRIKVLKLHGDLFHRFMAWTEDEMQRFLDDLDPGLSEVQKGRDLLVVGHSLRDERIAQIATKTLDGNGVVWYTHPIKRSEVLPTHDRLREVIDPLCAFESMFTVLASRLELITTVEKPSAGSGIRRGLKAEEPSYDSRALGQRSAFEPDRDVTGKAQDVIRTTTSAEKGYLVQDDPRAQTLDDLLAAVVGIGDYYGKAQATGVLIAEPRGILCDRYPVAKIKVGQKVTVRARDGEQWKLAVIRMLTDSPFGPVLLQAPERWTSYPLSVDPQPVLGGTGLRVAVFAGDRAGVSTGVVADEVFVTLPIAPVGVVNGIVQLHLAVAPGSSGAPVVDASLKLRGFIVAGTDDLENPMSFMDPASRWYAQLSVEKPKPRTRHKTT